MKVALVHDWLTGMRGGEKCLEAFCHLYPEADLFTLIHVPGSVSGRIEDRRIVTSVLQRFPGSARWYRFMLPLMPMAIEALDLNPYDLVISSSHCVAKGVLPRPDALHVAYVHTPMRYAWDLWTQYFPRSGPAYRLLLSPMLNYLRNWDVVSAARVDRFVANSGFVARRIQKYYRREATVVHPPVDTGFFRAAEGEPRDYYLMVTALVPYKGVDLAIRAFNELGRPLKIVGDGHLRRSLSRQSGPRIEFLGRVSDETLRDLYAGCRAVILPAVEDFGIVPLEANAVGRPVIALGRGGALDTVVPFDESAEIAGRPPTGVFFDRYETEALRDGVVRFETNERAFHPALLREHALRFDKRVFQNKMRSLLGDAVEAWRHSSPKVYSEAERPVRKRRA